MLERRKLVVEEPEGNAIVADHLADLFIGEELKEALQRSILRKKNIILQGPPGTGKTFIAKRLARHLGAAPLTVRSRWSSSTSPSATRIS